MDPGGLEAVRAMPASPMSLETSTLPDLGMQLVPIMAAFEEVFNSWQARAVPLAAIDQFGERAVGARVSFDSVFRTKGMTGPEKQNRDTSSRATVVLPLDPRWVTTSTAFHHFTSGRQRFAGLGLLKLVTDERAVVSPLVIGLPPFSDEIKAFYDALSRWSAGPKSLRVGGGVPSLAPR